MKSSVPLLPAALAAVLSVAHAGPSDYVVTPTVEVGEREIDFKIGSATNAGAPRATAASIGFGYGAREWWFTEIYAKYKAENREGRKFDAIEWENKFQITETGKYPIDLGMLIEIERPADRAEGWEVTWGPLLQTEFGRWQVNANLLLQRSYRVEIPANTEFRYQWQTKYRWRKELEFGLQGFGETGPWNAWLPREEQNHRIGPAIFGKLGTGGRQQIQYNVAWLFGASQAAPGHTLRAQVELEF